MVSNVKRKSKRKSKRKKIPDKWEQKKKKNQKDTYQKQKWEKNEKNKTEPNQIRTSLGTSTLLFENKCMRFIYTLKDIPCSNKNRSGPVHMYGYPRYRVPHTYKSVFGCDNWQHEHMCCTKGQLRAQSMRVTYIQCISLYGTLHVYICRIHTSTAVQYYTVQFKTSTYYIII